MFDRWRVDIGAWIWEYGFWDDQEEFDMDLVLYCCYYQNGTVQIDGGDTLGCHGSASLYIMRRESTPTKLPPGIPACFLAIYGHRS